MKATVNASFAAKHQLRIDLPNGEHVRFAAEFVPANTPHRCHVHQELEVREEPNV